mmetsp:Transcript_22658/g.35013  ORF Transcript_22658/g.35013 Transcript_22658/m.35013 type:complete len:230 (-) Transcript_22658:500-1189(-)
MRAFSSQVLAALALLVFSPTIMRVFAFAPRAGSIVSSSGALVNRRAVPASRLAFADAPKTPRAVRSMAMIFDKIFGNNPGPPDVANYYGVLEGAAREQGEAAIAGEVPATSKAGHAIATFAGGCFWGLELAFQRVPGVVETSVGYTQGAQERPTYSGVCSGATGHTEAVQVYYNPEEVSFTQLCNVFFRADQPHHCQRAGQRLRHPVPHRRLHPHGPADDRGPGRVHRA